MKIKRIEITNFQGVRSLTLDIRAPITIIAGPNMAGKSSVRDAVELALTGQPRRVSLKKDFQRLVHDGEKSGRVILRFAEPDGAIAGFKVPDGTWMETILNGRDPREIATGLDAQRFAAMTNDERRTFLFAAMQVPTSPEAIKARLLAKNLDAGFVDLVAPMLRAGFEAAHKEAAGAARDAKGAWRGVTGETYGGTKADGWQPPGGEWTAIDQQDLSILENRIESNRAGQAQENQAAGSYRAKREAYEAAVGQRNRLKAEAERVDEMVENVQRAQKELTEQRDKVAAMRAAAMPAHLLNCPQCDTVLTLVGGKLEIAAAPSHDVTTSGNLAEHEQAERMLENALASRQRLLGAAEAAVQALSVFRMPEAPGDPPTSRLDALRAEAGQLAKDRDAMIERKRAADARGVKAKQAARHHADVKAWLAIADELAPDGLPDELLREAIGPLNERAKWAASIAGWPVPQITPAMEIESIGRPYPLLSESEKWRVDAVFACAFAAALRTGLLLLDRWDVLDIPSRGQAVKMLRAVREPFGIETALLLGTLKAPPAGPLPIGVESVWLPDCVNVPAATTEAAAA